MFWATVAVEKATQAVRILARQSRRSYRAMDRNEREMVECSENERRPCAYI